MPWGWECRQKHIKQIPVKDTERRGPISLETRTPGPDYYAIPEILGGPGYSKINRQPAYTFGKVTKIINKPAALPNAPMFNVCGMGPKGVYKIRGNVVTPQIGGPSSKLKVPGPGAYAPRGDCRYKRPPAYSLRLAARPPYQSWDQWTPPPNMYLPPIPEKRVPAYSFGYQHRNVPRFAVPGPGSHEPNFNYIQKSKPAFSFGARYRPLKPPLVPPPNTYCEKKFRVINRSTPAPSFGIRHSPYLGVRPAYLKSSKLDIRQRETT